jgi:hypothetical protein
MAWNLIGEFLFKDIVSLCVCAVLFLAPLGVAKVAQKRSTHGDRHQAHIPTADSACLGE